MKFQIVIYNILIITSICNVANSIPISVTIDLKFNDDCRKFVLLHLITDLRERAHLMIETYEGRKWLRAWEDERTKILNRIFFSRSHAPRKSTWLDDWIERSERFNAMKNYYVRNIYQKPDSPWPKVSFDPESLKLTLHDDDKINYERSDPIVTDNDINEALRFYRPLKKNEDDSESHRYHQKLKNIPIKRNDERTQYPLIHYDGIDKLVKARYDLLRESFKGKRKSELDFESVLLHGQRISFEIDNWEKHTLKETNDDLFNKRYNDMIPINLRLLSDDRAFRRYLICQDDDYYSGNLFASYRYRYDLPEKHGFNYEFNGERLTSYSRYKALRDLANDISDYERASNDFTNIRLQDLPMINSILENFKTLTFWYNSYGMNHHDWIYASVPKTGEKIESMFMIVPKNARIGSDSETIFKEFQVTLNEAKQFKKTNNDLNYLDSMNERNKRFKDKMIFYLQTADRNRKVTVRWQTTRVNSLLSYTIYLERANLLSFDATKINVPLRRRSDVSKNNNNNDDESLNYDPIPGTSRDGDRFEKKLTIDELALQAVDSLDPNSNIIVTMPEKESSIKLDTHEDNDWWRPWMGSSFVKKNQLVDIVHDSPKYKRTKHHY